MQDDKEMLREIACLLTSREDIHHVQVYFTVFIFSGIYSFRAAMLHL